MSSDRELVANIANTIWTALEQQAKEPMGPYIDRDNGIVDTSGAGLNMTAVAEAIASIFVDSQNDCSWCHNPCAIDGWKQPITEKRPNAGESQ